MPAAVDETRGAREERHEGETCRKNGEWVSRTEDRRTGQQRNAINTKVTLVRHNADKSPEIQEQGTGTTTDKTPTQTPNQPK